MKKKDPLASAMAKRRWAKTPKKGRSEAARKAVSHRKWRPVKPVDNKLAHD